MSREVVLDETIQVKRPLREAFAYVADFHRIEEWDPAVRRGRKLTDGAVDVGTEFRIDMKAGFSLHYRVVEFEPGRRMLMEVESRLFTAVEEILFDGDGEHSTIRYIARFRFPAVIALASAAYPEAMERVGKAAMTGLRRALQDRYAAPVPSTRIAVADRLVLPGIWRFTRLGYRESRRRWNPVTAYLGDRHAIVTGATSGLGLAAATRLAELGARLTLVARDRKRARAVVRDIRQRTGNDRIDIEIADLSLMVEVHRLADRLLERGEPVDILVNNAGALFNPRQETKEGLEKSFALLLLSPYILTERLEPLLERAGKARVVNVSSGGMYTQRIRVRDLQYERGSYSGAVAYARAKRGLMILTEEWARRWRQRGIVVNAMHPGWANTPGVLDSLPAFHRLTRPLLRSPEEGADTIVWLAAATEAGKVSGKFWLDREQHPSHITERTRETRVDRELLLELLAEYLDATRPSAPRARRSA
jgi:NAD(P)-dependent dehydrogenase (short-subunit alcohol dehydrogenase family)